MIRADLFAHPLDVDQVHGGDVVGGDAAAPRARAQGHGGREAGGIADGADRGVRVDDDAEGRLLLEEAVDDVAVAGVDA